MKKLLVTAMMLCCAGMVMAQKIDFNQYNANPNTAAAHTADGFTMWVISNASQTATETFNGVEVTLAVDASTEAKTFRSVLWKDGVSKNNQICDGVTPRGEEPGSNNTPAITSGPVAMTVTVKGLSAGHHSLLAYHNEVDGKTNLPTIGVSVDGVVKVQGVQQTTRCEKISDCAKTYVEFDVVENQPVVITYFSETESGKTYGSASFFINSLEFDTNPYTALEPYPANLDLHADADDGSITLSWKAPEIAKSHAVVWGTDREEIETSTNYQYQGNKASCTISGLTPMQPYYWRVDEISENGTVYQGNVWTFQPRRDAFPGAEGYGRYAIGGRGGVVYHVTNLEDNGDDNNPIAGSLRYGIKKVSGPRTIVFDVAGVISLKSRLTCSDKFVTIAGQTAPGNGILLRTCPFGMQSDGITRFLRMRLGHKKLINNLIPGGKNSYSYGTEEGTTDETTLGGLDGMGMSGNDHAIMDHCSISWTIDEAFSSRNAKGMTLQRTLISEALNQAGHPNYSSGTKHGYAATIGGGELGGQPGSYHHNLLAHCEGRNWSISGGLDGKGAYDGHHDIYNNVVYNYGGRATDGGTHEMNFCNNYYKMGANSTSTIMNLQLEGTGTGTQSVYVHGNIRQEKNNGSLTEDKKGTTYKYSTSGGQVVDWDPLPTTPFDFMNPEGNMETAKAAFKNVLSDVGCSQPFFDKHDQRMVSETLAGTTSTQGSRSGKKGLIDSEEDQGCEGFDLEKLGIVNAQREAGWDSDEDGIPDWFEQLTGTNPAVANNNDDRDGDFYTDLEEYLNWIAVPNFRIEDKQEILLKDYFAGYKSPGYEVTASTGVTAQEQGGKLTVTPSPSAPKLFIIKVKATEDGISLTRDFHFAVTSGTTGISSVGDQATATDRTAPYYNLQGRRIVNCQLKKGLYIHNGGKVVIH